MEKKIVVLGGGYAGILVAKKLEKKLKGKDVSITLIDKNPFHTMLTELHEVAAYRVEEESIRLDLKKIFAGRKVDVLTDNIKKVDYDNNKLFGEKGKYIYDYLVLATGCKPTFFGVKGAEENSFTLWSYEDSVRLRYHIAEMFRQAAIELDIEKKKALLSFYVIGCGFTGIEMIGELAELAPIFCKQYGIDPALITLRTLDMTDRIMPILPEKATNRAMKRLAKMGVEVMLNTTVTYVGPDSLTYGKDEKTARTHTVIWAAGTQGSDIVLDSAELGHAEKSRNSRIQVDGQLRSLKYPNVYVGGDNMYYIPPGETTSVPQMVENCEHCAPIIAKNIVEEIEGKEPSNIYKPTFHGVMVCIGGRYGVAHVGLPGKMFVLPSFLAMLSKHFINMIYFVQVLGWHKVYVYIHKQFLTIRNRRSFVGGHLSNRGPLFLTVPLRLWLGGFFINKAYESFALGYLNNPRLGIRFHTFANTFFADFFAINLWDHFRFSTFMGFQEITIIFQTSIMGWFLETFVINTPANEMFWQHVILIFQLLVGLALIAGLLTTLASIGVFLYTVITMATVGLPISMMWLLVAPIAFMFIGGKVLALDYYVMPWLKEKWMNVPFVKKWYLYN
ncbi:MAG: FAD-dependent oxidoreductase [Defluviitaleaceae bacterium]|nr:FAD-dependent oxidoreductase [Defluviitaleaceae bacterium]